MKKLFYSLFLILFISFFNGASAQTIWDGPPLVFAKAAFANHTLEENQDRISDNVWITRANTQGLFNIKSESSYNEDAPAGTEWAVGTTAEIGSLVFSTWVSAVNSNPPGSLNVDMVLHLISEDIYIDIKFLSWGVGSGGGGSFSYSRSTEMVSGIEENEIFKTTYLYPNPAIDMLNISTELNIEELTIYKLANGSLIKKVNFKNGNQLDISNLSPGAYVLVTKDGLIRKFLKW